MIVTIDVDLVVIDLYVFQHINVPELWIEFGKKGDRCLLNHYYAQILDKKICRTVISFPVISGYDTLSQLQGHDKPAALKAWKTFPEVTDAFIMLFNLKEISTKDVAMIEHFIVLLYHRTC